MHARIATLASFALVLAPTISPLRAHAQLRVSVGTFGLHDTAPVDLGTSPIVGPECATPIPLSFVGTLPREDGSAPVIDVWWSEDEAASCELAELRASDVCRHVAIDAAARGTGADGPTLSVAASALFADLGTPCEGQRTTRRFVFLDASTDGDVDVDFVVGTFTSATIALDTVRPAAPVLDGDALGDTQLTLAWMSGSSAEEPVEARVHAAAGGCIYGRPVTTSALVAGRAASESTRVWSAPGDGPLVQGLTTLDTSVLGWSGSRYAETAVVGMTVVDATGNESLLSNVVCVEHVGCLGGDAGSSDCRPQGLCSVAAPGVRDRASLHALALLAIAVGQLVSRARRSKPSSPRVAASTDGTTRPSADPNA